MSNPPEPVTVFEQLKNKANFFDAQGRLFLVRCVACDRENWSMRVASGMCSWCGWSEPIEPTDTIYTAAIAELEEFNREADRRLDEILGME